MDCIKIPVDKQYQRNGKLYEIEYKHRAHMWVQYKIKYIINNKDYGLKTYNKR